MPRHYTPRAALVCAKCTRTFEVPANEASRRLFCSRACRHSSRLAMAPPAELRFWPKVSKDGPIPSHMPELGPCWLWTGFRNQGGYGTFAWGGRSGLAHVFAYLMTHGSVPTDTPHVTHLCDNGHLGCVRPSHLKADTPAGNMGGAAERGRMARGERQGSAKLSALDVQEIRRRCEQGDTQSALAHEYGVSPSTISSIKLRQDWRHV